MFGSNVEPRKFGRGRDIPRDWTCFCGHVNKKHLSRCEVCSLERDLVLANSEPKESND